MKVDIYRSNKNEGKYIFFPCGTDVSNFDLPDSMDPDLLNLIYFKKIDINSKVNVNRVALNCQSIEDQIKDKGYAIHKVSMIMEEIEK